MIRFKLVSESVICEKMQIVRKSNLQKNLMLAAIIYSPLRWEGVVALLIFFWIWRYCFMYLWIIW